MELRPVRIVVNGQEHVRSVEPRVSLADFLRDQLSLTGTTLGCEQGVCGCCTVLQDGRPVRACTRLAVQCDGTEITTVEGLAKEGRPSRLQQEFWSKHAFQCGFCTAGFLMSTQALLEEVAEPSEEEVRQYLQGNICRCTGYENIVKAVLAVAHDNRQEG